MPNWGEHILIANKLLDKIQKKDMKLNEKLFLFGNVLPDVQNGYLVEGISNLVSHKIDHYDSSEKDETKKWGYENFYDLYRDKMNNSIVLGYLTHLMTDYFWNRMFYDERCERKDNIAIGYVDLTGKLILKEKRQLRLDKQREFKIFQYYIYNNYEMKFPEYSDDVAKNANLISTININDNDVKQVIKYIEHTKEEAKNKRIKLKIFTIEELDEWINKTVDFIYEFLKNKSII